MCEKLTLAVVLCPDELLPTLMASTSAQACCATVPIARLDSMAPVLNSSSQSPPSAAAPVRSSLAATSAPVSWARPPTSARPSALAATSQPYSSTSASALSASPQLAIWAARANRVSPLSAVAPSSTRPALPWERMCTAATSVRPSSACEITAMPSSSAPIRITSRSTPASPSVSSKRAPMSVSASSTPASTKTSSWRTPSCSVPAARVLALSTAPGVDSGIRSAE